MNKSMNTHVSGSIQSECLFSSTTLHSQCKLWPCPLATLGRDVPQFVSLQQQNTAVIKVKTHKEKGLANMSEPLGLQGCWRLVTTEHSITKWSTTGGIFLIRTDTLGTKLFRGRDEESRTKGLVDTHQAGFNQLHLNMFTGSWGLTLSVRRRLLALFPGLPHHTREVYYHCWHTCTGSVRREFTTINQIALHTQKKPHCQWSLSNLLIS